MKCSFCSVFKVPCVKWETDPGSPCGDEGTRTPDLLRAREALSHLSYIPVRVGLTRLELVTFPLSEGCSNRLSYRPKKDSLRQIALQEPIYH